jgi:superfamily II DNA helicase RecQ
LEYFGEVNYEACGVCDICLKKKKQNPGKKNTEALAIALRANLMRRKTRERASKAMQINIDSEG